MNTRTLVAIFITLALIIAVFAISRLNVTGKAGSGLSKDFIYDINTIAKIDPNLILYVESVGPIGTGFTSSHAIAVASNEMIYVAGDKAVRIFSENGQVHQEVKLSAEPRCLAVANDNKIYPPDVRRIYVGMKDHVEIYDRQGNRLAAWQSLGDDAILTSIAVSENNVFVADAGDRIVIRYDGNGKVINYIGKKDKSKNIPGFVIPSPYFDIAVGSDGLLRAVNPGNHRIETYTFDGDLQFQWGKFSADLEGFTGCCNPVNFAILEDGTYVTCEKGLIRVKIYSRDGRFLGVVAGPQQLVVGSVSRICYLPAECRSGGFDVAVDTKGRVFVLDTIKNIVRIFSRKKAE